VYLYDPSPDAVYTRLALTALVVAYGFLVMKRAWPYALALAVVVGMAALTRTDPCEAISTPERIVSQADLCASIT